MAGYGKSQSAIEFMTTYSFVMIILISSILVVFFLVSSTRTDIGAQCAGYGSVSCSQVSIYSGRGSSFSLVTMVVDNGQNAPIEVSNVIVSYREVAYTGICAPERLLQGEEAVCLAKIDKGFAIGKAVQGYFSINANYCNSQLVNLGICNESVSYAGSFYAYSQPFQTPVYSVIAEAGNYTTQLPQYGNSPYLPIKYRTVNDGDWTPSTKGNSFTYAFATTGTSGNYLGSPASQFPQSLYYLNSNSVACSPPYNTTLSMASTGIYLSYPTSVTFNAFADNAIAAWYLPSGSTTWNSIYGNSGWSILHSFGPTSNTVTLGSGLYTVEVEWANTCGPGIQAFQISGSGVYG